MLSLHIGPNGFGAYLNLQKDEEESRIEAVLGGRALYCHHEDRDDVLFWVNPNAADDGVPINFEASVIANQPLCGQVIVTGVSPSHMHLRPVPDDIPIQLKMAQALVKYTKALAHRDFPSTPVV
jgi:hypothetical protein